MSARGEGSISSRRPIQWRRSRRLLREGFRELEYLPHGRSGWNATLAGHAFSARRALADRADLNLWAAMHACPPSARYAGLGPDSLVLWHGTTAERAKQILRFGLRHRRGVWASLEPRIAHTFTRSRSEQYSAGSATVVIVLDRDEAVAGLDYDAETPDVARFHHDLPARAVEYVLWDERVEFVGERPARSPEPWTVSRFKKKEGVWVPMARPPVRFDEAHSHADLEEWLDLSVRRIVGTLGAAACVEVFASLYATLDPWEAMEHGAIFRALERLCGEPRVRHGLKVFSLKEQ